MDQVVDRQSQMKIKRMNDISDSDMNDSIDNMTSDEMFLPQVMQPQVTINESPRFDANTVKREINDVQQPQSPNTTGFRGSYRKSFFSISTIWPTNFQLENFSTSAENSNANAMQNTTFSPYNFSDYANSDMTLPSELKPSIHMDIPAGEELNFHCNFVILWAAFMQICHCHSLRNVTSFSLTPPQPPRQGARKKKSQLFKNVFQKLNSSFIFSPFSRLLINSPNE